MDEGAKALSGPIPELIKTYAVLTWQGESWQILFQERNNHQRWRCDRFDPVTTQRLRLLFEAACADGPTETTPDSLYADHPGGGRHPNRVQVLHTARLFEVRIYHEHGR
jgi:hypothetical protein